MVFEGVKSGFKNFQFLGHISALKMKFKNRLGESESIHTKGLSPKNEPIRPRRLGCRGVLRFRGFSPCILLTSVKGLRAYFEDQSYSNWTAFLAARVDITKKAYCDHSLRVIANDDPFPHFTPASRS